MSATYRVDSSMPLRVGMDSSGMRVPRDLLQSDVLNEEPEESALVLDPAVLDRHLDRVALHAGFGNEGDPGGPRSVAHAGTALVDLEGLDRAARKDKPRFALAGRVRSGD